MKPSEVLQAARDLIAKPENWTQGSYARNAQGDSVFKFGGAPVSWCASGVMSECASRGMATGRAYTYLSTAMGASLPHFNDHHTHKEVLAAFDKAIAAAEANARRA